MTEEERRLLRLINQRVARMQPDMARAWRRFFQLLADEMGAQRVADLIAAQRFDDLLDDEAFDRAATPLRAQLQSALSEGFRLTLPDIAGALTGKTPNLLFDVINPRVTRTIEQLDSRTLDTLKASTQQALRDAASAGYVEGLHPTAIARDLRSVIGLSPQQAGFVRNMGDDLDNLDARYFTRQLRDKRYDTKVRKAIASGLSLSAEDRATIVSAYARKYTKYNTDINTRAATLNSYKLAQYEAYASAIDRGIYGPDEIEKIWIHFDPQKNPRLDHKEWHGTVVGFYQAFPDGQQQAGIGYYGCLCTTQYRTRRSAGPLPNAATQTPAPTVDNATRLREALEQAEREIVRHKVEHAAAFDATGAEVLRKTTNAKSSVSFNNTEFARLKNTHFTHNHPGETLGLSDADVKFLITGDLAEMRAVTSGHVSRIIRPEGGWKADEWDLRIRPTMNRYHRALRAEWSDIVRAGNMTEANFQKNFWHELWTRVAKETGLDYRLEVRRTP